jgi:predicted nucleic acid-binding protein
MDSVVIDTDVLSYSFKQDSEGKFGIISFMTVAELEVWANMRNWGAHRRAQLAAFLAPYAVINSSRELAQTWAAIRSQVMRSGHHIDTADCWLPLPRFFTVFHF